jgi:hypothetical protein
MTLDANARALVEASRRALRSSAQDRERIEAALRARLGDAALPPDGGLTPSHGAATWPAAVGVAVGLCVLAGAAFYALRPGASAAVPHARPAVRVLQSAPAPVAPPAHLPAAEPEPAASKQNLATPAARPAMSPARTRDSLAREVALLSRATSELRAGHVSAAMKLLDEHEQRFPSGALSEERRAGKAQALCLLGRIGEGRAELARLTPHSPAAATAQQVCDGAASAASDRR